MPNSYVVVVPWEGGTCVPSKPEIEQQLRYGLVVRIPGSHPGGPGSIPGNGKLLFGNSLKLIFWVIGCCIACWLGSLKEGKNIASAGNLNCVKEGPFRSLFREISTGRKLIWKENKKVFRVSDTRPCIFLSGQLLFDDDYSFRGRPLSHVMENSRSPLISTLFKVDQF